MGREDHTVDIGIDGEELGRALSYRQSNRCLDFATGAIVPIENCPEYERGEGRAALRNGKRFIRIPVLDELRLELKAQYDKYDRADLEDDDSLSPQDEESLQIRELANRILAEEETALAWIRSLEPNLWIGWVEDDLGVTQVWDPEKREWFDAR
jgi:hypothetical protein